MAKKATNKKPLFGNLVSHSKRRTRSSQKVNLQTITIDGQKFKMSAREIRTIMKNA